MEDILDIEALGDGAVSFVENELERQIQCQSKFSFNCCARSINLVKNHECFFCSFFFCNPDLMQYLCAFYVK